MSVLRIRTGLKTWLTQNFSIQRWDLDVPENQPRVLDDNGTLKKYAANCAIALPIQELTIFKDGDELIKGEALFKYLILFRIRGDAAKHQLPVDQVELLVNYLAERAAKYPGEISEDISSIETETIDSAVSLGRVEGEDGDWLIIAKPEFRIEFTSFAQEDLEDSGVLQPAPGAIDGTQTFIGLDISLNVSDLPAVTPDLPDTYSLDQTLELPET